MPFCTFVPLDSSWSFQSSIDNLTNQETRALASAADRSHLSGFRLQNVRLDVGLFELPDKVQSSRIKSL